ncbi:MAG: dihydrolipoamide dehydrogenase [Flavobacteriaceae bacterium]|nr:dihydrolipoamide dehydrogenase [Flavobacteriaceae bacterium]|tara:strand:+ start:798 stop:1643 length:846 start_codon:yes stop_codon:yes gene_type:complete
MKKLLLFICAIVTSVAVQAQLQTPAPSPFQKIEQKVGLTDVTLEYSRPSMKGRTIFGGLVPYDNVWRTGANANTKITFSDDVIIGGKTVKAGSYAIYTKPGMQSWDVMFYTDSNNWGTPQKWDESKVAASVSVPVYPLPMPIETLTMSFDDLTNDSANLGIMWDKTYVGVPIKFETDKMVSASIDKVMNGPGANEYYQAAVYYLESGKDINKAKTWIDKAIEMRAEPAFWYHRQQSLIYAKAGDKKGAINAAKKSLSLAQEAGNDDYVALNTKSLKEWGAM